MSAATEPEPLSKAAAKTLDQKIRRAADKSATHIRALLDLLEHAVAGEVYAALGYPSTTAWLHDAVRLDVSDAAHRKVLVALMSDRRLSPKTIVEAFRRPALSPESHAGGSLGVSS